MSDDNKINFRLETPLDDTFTVLNFRGKEDISGSFHYLISTISINEAISFDDLIGKKVSLFISQPHTDPAVINGIVSSFSQTSAATDRYGYELVLEPWTSFLSFRSNCKIFQNQTVLETLQEVFDSAGFAGDYVDETSGAYPSQEYTVQFNETDFDFMSRLMADNGIYYYFRFEAQSHILVLVDNTQALDSIVGGDLPYLLGHRKSHSEEGISKFKERHNIRSTAVSLRDYQFTRPSADTGVTEQSDLERERYEYPGGYSSRSDGEAAAKKRFESYSFDTRCFSGNTNSRRLSAGTIFSLTDHPVEELNSGYLLLSVSKSGAQDAEESCTYESHFTAISSETPFRVHVQNAKPSFTGIQTATVVGPDGEEVWLDSYGRIKVQFHWDRLGENIDTSSCWIRVAQAMAGANWGTVFHPRIGHEVIVQFLNGNIDKPVVTGSLYNEEHMPPYNLPANGSQTVIKTRSTPGGGVDNFNELRFEDKKNEEHVLLHAEKDLMLEAENDETHSVGNNRTVSVGVNENYEVKGNRTHTVAGDETTTVSANRTETVEVDETVTINGNRTETVLGDETVTLDSTRTLSITKEDTINIGGDQAIDLGADQSITIAGKKTLNVGKVLSVEAGDEITLTCGSASLSMKKDGTIEISGKNISINGEGKLTAEGLMGAEFTGKTVDVSGQTMVNVKGAMVNLN